MNLKNLLELKKEIDHIFESGANELRVLEMVDTFIDKRYVEKEAQPQLSCLGNVSSMSLSELKLDLSNQQVIYSTKMDLIQVNNANWRMTLIMNELNKRNGIDNCDDKELTQCMMGRDAECNHPKCPITDEDAENGIFCKLPFYDYRQ